jgi:hypothetical protein
MHQAIKRQLTSWLFAINSNKRSLLLSALFVGCIVIGVFLFGDAAFAVEESGGSLDVDLGAFNSPANWFIRILSQIMLVIGELCITLTTFALEFLIRLAQYNDFSNAPPVLIGWFMIRDLANMFFVVALLVIAFGTILGLEQYEWKKALGKLVIAAILINFSKLIAQVIIDAAHVVTITFLNAIASTAGGNIINMFGLDDLYKITNTIPPEQLAGQGLRLDLFVASFMIMMFSALVLITIGVYFLLLLIRMVVLWTLIIISPFAYILQILPQTKSYAQEYWKEFINHVILAPMMVFFLWLAFASFGSGTIAQELQIDPTSAEQAAAGTVVTGLNNGAVIQNPTASLSAGTTWENMANLAIAIAFLLMGIERVQKLGVKGGSLLSNVTKFGKYVAAIGSGYVVGRGAYELGKKGAKTVVGKGLLPVAKKLSGYNALKHQVHKGALQAYRGLRNTPYAGRLLQSGDRRKGEIDAIQGSIDDQSKRYSHEGAAKAFNSDDGIARESIRRKAAKEVKDGAEGKSEAELKLRILSDYSDQVDSRVASEKARLEKKTGESLTSGEEKDLRKRIESQVLESPGFRSGEAKHFAELLEGETVKEQAKLATEIASGQGDKVFYQKKLQDLIKQRGIFEGRYSDNMRQILEERAKELTSGQVSGGDIDTDEELQGRLLLSEEELEKRAKSVKDSITTGVGVSPETNATITKFRDQIASGDLKIEGKDGKSLNATQQFDLAVSHSIANAEKIAKEQLIAEAQKEIGSREIDIKAELETQKTTGVIVPTSSLGTLVHDQLLEREENGEFDHKEKIDRDRARGKARIEILKSIGGNVHAAATESVVRERSIGVTQVADSEKELLEEIDSYKNKGVKYKEAFSSDTRHFIDERVDSIVEKTGVSKGDARKEVIAHLESNSGWSAKRRAALQQERKNIQKQDKVKARLTAVKGLKYFESFEAASRGAQKTGKHASESDRLKRQVGDILRSEEGKDEKKLREWEDTQYREELAEYALKDFPRLFGEIEDNYKLIKNLKVKEADGTISDQEKTNLKNARQNQMRALASSIEREYGNFLGEYLAGLDDSFKGKELNDPEELHKVILGLTTAEGYGSFDSPGSSARVQEQLRKDLKADKAGLLFRNLSTASSKAASNGQWQFYSQFSEQIDEFGDRKVGLKNIAKAGIGSSSRLGTGGSTNGNDSRHSSQIGEALVNYTLSSTGDGRAFVRTKTRTDGSKLSTGFHNEETRAAALGITQLRGKKAVTQINGSVFNFLTGGKYDESTYDESTGKFNLTSEQTEIRDFWGEAIGTWERDFNRSSSPAQKDTIVSAILEIMRGVGIEEQELNFNSGVDPQGRPIPNYDIWNKLRSKFDLPTVTPTRPPPPKSKKKKKKKTP